MPTLTKLYSMQEISEHNNKDDCWIIVDGKVYDVTQYLDEHPGGDDVLLTATGRDSTEDFEDAGHSADARELMQDYFIGELDPTTVIPKLEIVKKDDNSFFTSMISGKNIYYWAVPAALTGLSVVVGILYSRKK